MKMEKYLTKDNLRDFKEIEKLITMKSIYNCFFCCSNDTLKVPGKEHRNKSDNIKEFIKDDGDGSIIYPSVTYGTRPNAHCKYYLKKQGLGGFNGWFNVFLVLYERNKQQLKQWLLTQEDL